MDINIGSVIAPSSIIVPMTVIKAEPGMAAINVPARGFRMSFVNAEERNFSYAIFHMGSWPIVSVVIRIRCTADEM